VDHQSILTIEPQNGHVAFLQIVSSPLGLTHRDPAHDCKKVRIKLKKLGYDSLIPQKKLCRKRLRVENAFYKLKMSRRLMVRYAEK
jgi:hypothetical protein